MRFLLSAGPMILTTLRRKVSPAASKKNVRKSTTVAWPATVTTPSVPMRKNPARSGRLFNLNACYAAWRRRSLDPAVGCRTLQLVGSLLHVIDCTGRGSARPAQCSAKVLRSIGQGFDQRSGIVTERIRYTASASQYSEQKTRRPHGTGIRHRCRCETSGDKV